ncbi:MAG: hypothetical protein ACJAXJ_004428, partial [Colwellia sp.]
FNVINSYVSSDSLALKGLSCCILLLWGIL